MLSFIDKLALSARKYERQLVARSGSERFSLGDLLETFDRQAILELTPVVDGKPGQTLRPDPVNKRKVSLLDDGVSALRENGAGWYEVFRTAPSGDLSRVRIVAYGGDGRPRGELRMLVGQRRVEHYFKDDPILERLRREGR